jgi:hypothetical protein
MGVDKILARQNIGVEKIYATTKCWRMYKSGGASSYCFGPAKSEVSGFSQILLMFFSLKMLSSPHAVTK